MKPAGPSWWWLLLREGRLWTWRTLPPETVKARPSSQASSAPVGTSSFKKTQVQTDRNRTCVRGRVCALVMPWNVKCRVSADSKYIFKILFFYKEQINAWICSKSILQKTKNKYFFFQIKKKELRTQSFWLVGWAENNFPAATRGRQTATTDAKKTAVKDFTARTQNR